MTATQTFAESVSEAMGLDGEINDAVRAQAQILTDQGITNLDSLTLDERQTIRAVAAIRRRERWVGDDCDCGMWHPADRDDDCRDDNHRLPLEPDQFLCAATPEELKLVGLTERQAHALAWSVVNLGLYT